MAIKLYKSTKVLSDYSSSCTVSPLCKHMFHIHGFNQMWIENIRKKISGSKT